MWHFLFQVVAYGSLLACLYHAISYYSGGNLWKVVREILLLLLFVFLYWILESYATHVSNYYFYPPNFSDTIPPFDQWHWLPFLPGGGTPDPCGHNEIEIGISLSILLMEGSLTYAMMWTVRLFSDEDNLYLWPFAVGLAMLAIDAFLDPVVALSYHCETDDVEDPGVGFWHWYANEEMGVWYHWIPLFNWLAWFAAPIALVAAALLLKWARDFIRFLQGELVGSSIPGWLLDGFLKAILMLAFFLLFVLAPVRPGDNIVWEAAVFILILLGSIVAIIWYRSTYKHDHPISRYWQLLVPQIGFHTFSLVAILFSGFHPIFPSILLWAVIALLGIWYAITPYWKP